MAELILAIGAALLLGNGLALYRHRQGRKPDGVAGELRPGRVVFLLVVGALMTAWGLLSLLLP